MKEPIGHKVMSLLKRYGNVQDDFLAKELGRSVPELEPCLQALQNENLIERQNHMIRSARHSQAA